jgi:hypothetical protein
LIEVVHSTLLRTPVDFVTLLPMSLPRTFTNRELAEASAQPRYLAQRMTYSLRHMGALQIIGRRKRELLYARAEEF